jgi:hypothetical protein
MPAAELPRMLKGDQTRHIADGSLVPVRSIREFFRSA